MNGEGSATPAVFTSGAITCNSIPSLHTFDLTEADKALQMPHLLLLSSLHFLGRSTLLSALRQYL
jgi:hypothetical protein